MSANPVNRRMPHFLAEAMLYAQRKKPVTDRKWAEKFLYPNNPILRISVPNRE